MGVAWQVMGMKSKVRGVSRLESGKYHHGWRVSGWDQKKGKVRYLRFFSDSSHGGGDPLKSREAAEAFAKEHRAPTKRRSFIRADGLPTGVRLVRRFRDDRWTEIAVASIKVDGEIYSAEYTVREGLRTKKEAIAKAIATRKAFERRAYGEPLKTLTREK